MIDNHRNDTWTCIVCETCNSGAECTSCGEFNETSADFEAQVSTENDWQCTNCCVNNEHNLQFCPCCSTPKAGNHPGNSTKAGMGYDIILIC